MTDKAPSPKICPIHYALNGIGDKWSLLIIRDLMFFAKRYYNEFLSSPEGISTNILADRLAKLEQHGLLAKTPGKNTKARFRYTLTEKGLALMPVVMEMMNWSASYDDNTAAPMEYINLYRKDRSKLLKFLLDKYQAVEEKAEESQPT